MILGTPAERGKHRAPMERRWRQTGSVSNHGNVADPHLRESSVPMALDNSEGYEWHDSSSHIRENTFLLPYSDDRSTRAKHKKDSFLPRAASASAKYDKSARRRLEQGAFGNS